jgi:hypothetical protein
MSLKKFSRFFFCHLMKVLLIVLAATLDEEWNVTHNFECGAIKDVSSSF